MRRRTILTAAAASGAAALGLTGCASSRPAPSGAPRVLIVGGGFGGAAAAKALRQGSKGRIDVTLIDPAAEFVSCPMSNLVLVGARPMDYITHSYAALATRHGVQLRQDEVVAIEPEHHRVRLASGATLPYDKLLLSPGVGMMWDEIDGLHEAQRQGRVLQAWQAGPETLALRRQLEAMPDGGVFAMAIPEAPYRCPPAPYERASLVAEWLAHHRPRAKVIIVDANEDVTSKGALFKKAWATQHAGRLEYRPQHRTVAVDAASGTLKFEIQDDLRADVLNVLPPMRAADIAVRSGLANVNQRWCEVHCRNFASTRAPDIHVIGDAIQAASAMPKSGQMAQSQAEVVAAALVAELTGGAPDAAPSLHSTCFSFVDARHAMRLSSTHTYLAETDSYGLVGGRAQLSEAPSEADAVQADVWARDLWSRMLD